MNKTLASIVYQDMMTLMDPTKFRVNLVCSCNNDIAFGYGPTIETARVNAAKFFRRHHGKRASWREEIVEEAVTNPSGSGSHYEEVQP